MSYSSVTLTLHKVSLSYIISVSEYLTLNAKRKEAREKEKKEKERKKKEKERKLFLKAVG